MAGPSNEEIARALDQLASGEVAPSEELPLAPVKSTRAASPIARPASIPESASAVPEDSVLDELAPDEEDWLTAPVPITDQSPKPAAAQSAAEAVLRKPLYQTLGFRRTIIPILLTCGVLTLAVASLKFVLPEDSLFADFPFWLPIALALAGTMLLLLAIMNMLSVRNHSPSSTD